MKYFLLKRKQKSNFEGLLKLSNILISRRNSKKEIIEELCVLISQNEGLDSNEVFKEVWLREAEMSTGIINGFAVPHARLPIQKPVIALAIN
ncbi:MAG: PTS sugar transporter subunit IIA, partial [Ignavibacteria bacterium]|nr:PTS sugar transporter subunit IIA [Ignavibacteria bacterium]